MSDVLKNGKVPLNLVENIITTISNYEICKDTLFVIGKKNALFRYTLHDRKEKCLN